MYILSLVLAFVSVLILWDCCVFFFGPGPRSKRHVIEMSLFLIAGLLLWLWSWHISYISAFGVVIGFVSGQIVRWVIKWRFK